MSEEATQAAPSAADIRAAAQKAKPKQRGVVLIPEWGGSIYIETMTGDQRAAFDRETARRKRKDPDRIRPRERLIIATATDQAGAKIFTAADEEMLATMEVGPVDRAFKLSARLNGFIDDEDEAGN
jgi:hypothetical protein